MQQRIRVLRAELLIPGVHRASPWLLCALIALFCTNALGHGPAPAPLEVLAYDASASRATLVRTSIGLARDHHPLGWTYVCPSQHGDREQARAGTLSASETTLIVGGGDIYRSTDELCSFQALEHDEATYALDLFTMDESFWLLALTEGEEGRLLLRVDAQGPARLITAFQGESPLRIDSLARFGEWGAVGLASSPTPTLVLGQGTLSSPEDMTWVSSAIDAFPESTSHIDIRRVNAAGELWVVIASEAGRELWRGTPEGPPEEGPTQWTRVGEPATTLLGPVSLSGELLLVRDGRLEHHQGEQWGDLGEVNYTALDELQGEAFAYTLTEVYRLDGLEEGAIVSQSVFQMEKLLAPLEGCPPSAAGQDACESDWVHFGAEVGLLDPNQLTTPASASAEPSRDTRSDGGCGTAGTAPLNVAPLIAMLLWSLWRRYVALMSHERSG